MWILSLLMLHTALAQRVELSPIEVNAKNFESEATRSVNWPVDSEEVTPAVQLPQWDDAINSTNGIQTRTQGSPTFSIRGSAQSGRALVLYDHIPLNFATGFGAPRIFLPKETLQQLVVVKGPGSLFYGSQAMAGAIDFISKTYEAPEININFSDTNESFLPWREGSLAHQSYQLATPLYKSARTRWQSSLFYEDDDGVFPFQNANASGERNFNASNLSRLSLKGIHTREDWRWDFNAIAGRQITQSPGPINFPLETRQENDGILLSLSPHWFLSDDTSLKSRLTYLKSEADFLESNNLSYTDLTTGILQNEFVYNWGLQSKLQVFADLFFHEMDSNFSGDNLKQDNFELGPFVSFEFFKGITHQVGGRYLLNFDRFLPSLSTHVYFYDLDSWLSYSEGFRNPSLSDLFSQSPFFLGNADLEPETSRQVEWGLKNETPLPWQWEVRLFHIEYQNFIESYEVTPGVFSRANRGGGYSRGLDGSLAWKGRMLQPSITYNYLDSHSRELNRAFRLSPRHQLTLGTDIDLERVRITVQNTHWYDTVDVSLNQAVELEDWQQWNFFLHFLQTRSFRVSLGLINAFNEGKQLTLNYPEPQRKYWLQIHQSF